MENYGNVEGSGNGDADAERWTGRGRGRGVRSSGEDSSHLRRPHHPPEGISDIVKNSVLSADAAEFVPKSSFTSPTQLQSGRSSVQQRLDLARQSQNVQQAMIQRQPQLPYWQQVGHYQHVYRQHQHQHQQYSGMGYHGNQHGMQHQQYNQYPVIQNYSNYNAGSDDYIMSNADASQPIDLPTCLSQLENAMKTLTMNPGKFDSLVAHLVDTISSFLDQPSQCKDIFGLILQQSINEGNFRYSGARLCTHLDTVASAADKSTSSFRDILIEECKKKTDEQAETWQQMTKHTDDIEKKCHGLIFFLAELVTQMEAAPASELGKLLIRLINTVLLNPAPTSAKNICQALKLAGQTLERDNSGNRAEMEQVMRTLSELVIQGRVDVHVGRMVTSVSELRSGNWGKGTTHTAPIIENQQSSSQVADEPIFYGPDGQVLTDEESRFLEAAAEGEAMPEDPWENDNEDDVIAEAYEEFLKLPPNNNKANKNNIQTNNSKEH